jgi:hypothetical protein
MLLKVFFSKYNVSNKIYYRINFFENKYFLVLKRFIFIYLKLHI